MCYNLSLASVTFYLCLLYTMAVNASYIYVQDYTCIGIRIKLILEMCKLLYEYIIYLI